MNDAATAQIRTWLDEFLADPEYARAFPVAVRAHDNGRVEVFVDADDAVDFALCRRISRHLEERLDETLLLGERYTLEVSSPGVSCPLTLPRQFGKHLGRTLAVALDDGATVTGELVEVTEGGLTLRESIVVRDERNKKRKSERTHDVAFGTFSGAEVQVSFR